LIRYRFSGRAKRDAGAIVGKLHIFSGAAAADRFESDLFATLEELSRLNGPGYRRPDITDRDCLFYRIPPYVLVFQKRAKELFILRLLHSASDLRNLL
jgi:plasmid stabilization system protein ParE